MDQLKTKLDKYTAFNLNPLKTAINKKYFPQRLKTAMDNGIVSNWTK